MQFFYYTNVDVGPQDLLQYVLDGIISGLHGSLILCLTPDVHLSDVI